MHVNEIAASFAVEGSVTACYSFGNGHINETYRVETDSNKTYILQKINRYVFRQPEAVMENIIAVTDFLYKKDTDNRHAMRFLKTVDGADWYTDPNNDVWRMYHYLEGFCLDGSDRLEDHYQSALAFGRFQMLLSDFPAEALNVTIPRFHDTPDRFRQLRVAAEENRSGRKDAATDVLAGILSHEELASSLHSLWEAGLLPTRVTHNDTKLNNVLLDSESRKGVCILDLDTVMPGLSLHDFGDAVRFGAATAEEDTRDLDAMQMDVNIFRAYVQGYLAGATTLTPKEIEMLHIGPIVLTLETAARFLKDFLDGDLYFKTAYAEHNLVRARAQWKLAEDMVQKLSVMQEIVAQEYHAIHH